MTPSFDEDYIGLVHHGRDSVWFWQTYEHILEDLGLTFLSIGLQPATLSESVQSIWTTDMVSI